MPLKSLPACAKLPAYLIAFLVLAFCFIANSALTQTCVPIFKKTYSSNGNDEAKDILHTNDNGSIIVGQTTSNTQGNYDALVMKISEQGVIAWSKQLGGNADDHFTRIKSTADGGYIAIGSSKSYGNSNGEVILVKIDNPGNLVWARHYGTPGVKTVAKEVIQLADGSFVFLANENDSTIQSNGIVCKVDANGNVLWTKTFDHGNDDGFNYVMEDGANIYITGHVSIGSMDGILMQLDKTNGNLVSVKKFTNGAGYNEDILNIYKIPGGFAFAVNSVTPTNNSFSRLTLLKMRDDGTLFYSREAQVSTASGQKIEAINVITTNDGGFVYLASDTTPYGRPKAVLIGPTANSEWGQDLYDNLGDRSKMKGIDKNGSNGYLYAGFIRVYENQAYKNKIAVFTTDMNGAVRNCTTGWIGAFVDTVHYAINSFSWNAAGTANLSVSDAIPASLINISFVTSTVCEELSCTGGAQIPAGCSPTFFSTYKSNRSYKTWDVTQTNDGGSAIVGDQMSFMSYEPFITRLKPNGDVLWSKTLNTYTHNGFFKKVLTAPDGNLVVLGVDNYVLNHSSYDSSVVMKVNANTGEVIWARYFRGDGYDIAATAGGGFVFCINANYGNPPLYSFVVKLDAAGNTLWQRQLRHSANPIYRSILSDAQNIYLAADYYFSNDRFQVVKLDLGTGNLVWTKKFGIPGDLFAVQGIKKVNDSIFLDVDFYSPGHVNPGMFCMNSDGSVIRAFKLNNPNFSLLSSQSNFNEHRAFASLKTSDDNFVVANQALQNADSSFSIIKFTGTGQVLWARKYVNLKKHSLAGFKESEGSLLLAGTSYLGVFQNSQLFNSFLLKTDLNGAINNAVTGVCYSEPMSATTIPLTHTEINTDLDSVTVIYEPMHAFIPHNRPIVTWAEMGCNTAGNCNSLSISGMATLCNTSDTITYTALRNLSCTFPVIWQTDPSRATILGFTDTTVKVKFLISGPAAIFATLNGGCALIHDTLLVNVSRQANTLDLGPDTTICENNTFVLRAGGGFRSYQWQNGSVSDSLVINSPGRYYVDVTDFCGGRSTDTVVASLHAPIHINAGPDRVKCNSDSIQIIAEAGFLSYHWVPGYNISSLTSAVVTVYPLATTSYFLKAEQTPGCFAFDTVNVTVHNSAPINLGSDTSICANDSVIIDAGSGFVSYLWNTGDTGVRVFANTPGSFIVTATDANSCKTTDTLNIIEVYPLPNVRLDKASELCAGTTRILNAGDFGSYLWQDGSSARTFTVQTTGSYYVKVTGEHGCEGSDTAHITRIIPLDQNFLPADTAICGYGTMALQPNKNFSSYIWSTGSNVSSVMISQPGIYWLQVKANNGCVSRDSIVVQTKECLKGLYVPTAFTPNADGKNDILTAFLFGSIQSFEFKVYNRYGQLVFISFDPLKGWDGLVRGAKQDTGNFVWVCRYRINGETERVEKGSSILIR